MNTIKPEKSNLLHELETLNEDNPKMYWKMINELQEKQTDSDNNNCLSPTRWLKHFQSLNEGKEHFKSRIKDLEDKLWKVQTVLMSLASQYLWTRLQIQFQKLN